VQTSARGAVGFELGTSSIRAFAILSLNRTAPNRSGPGWGRFQVAPVSGHHLSNRVSGARQHTMRWPCPAPETRVSLIGRENKKRPDPVGYRVRLGGRGVQAARAAGSAVSTAGVGAGSVFTSRCGATPSLTAFSYFSIQPLRVSSVRPLSAQVSPRRIVSQNSP